MKRRNLSHAFIAALALAALSMPALANDEAPDAFVKRISTDIVESIRADKTVRTGDLSSIVRLVEVKVMPNLNFQRMTASAVGPSWRNATPAQQAKLQEEFKTLLVRTYSGALAQVSDQVIVVKPLRYAPEDTELVVRTEIRGRGDPIQLDYRLEKTPGQGAGWKIFNLNVLGVWLVDTYRGQFAQEINARGIDGLIATLTERNRANSKKV